MITYGTLAIGKLFHDCTREWADAMADETYANTVPPDRPEELSSYNIIIFFNKESPLVYWRRGGMHERNKNLREAVNDYSKSVEIDSAYNGGYALLDRGYCKEKLNDLEGALIDHNKAIIVDPWKETYYYFRGSLNYKIGDKDGALNDLNAAIKLWDDFVHARLLRAQLLTEAEEFSRAMEDYDKCHLDDRYYDNSEYSSDFRNRGLCRHETGDTQGACFDWKVASKFDSLARMKFLQFCK